MKHLGSLESTQEARVAPNFRHASYRYLNESTLVHEQIVNFNLKLSFQTILIFFLPLFQIMTIMNTKERNQTGLKNFKPRKTLQWIWYTTVKRLLSFTRVTLHEALYDISKALNQYICLKNLKKKMKSFT